MNSKEVERIIKSMKGVSSHALVIGICIVLVIVHSLIIYLIADINNKTNDLTASMEEAAVYRNDASSLLAGSSLLSETSTPYILLPINEQGELNFGSLNAYAAELELPRRGSDIIARFEEYNVSDEVKEALRSAAESADYLIENQLHAIALVNSIYSFPPIPALQALPLPELTEKEQAMSMEERLAAARLLVLNTAYSTHKSNVSTSVNEALELINADSAKSIADMQKSVRVMRIWIWASTALLIIVIIFTFTVFLVQVVRPLDRMAKSIFEDTAMEENKGLREVRLVQYAYNGLLRRRDALDSILRSAAETDTLTGLQNRYSYEHYLLDVEEDGEPCAVIVFDVNYLKQTNDNFGHQAGDKLLKTCSACIEECFGSGTEKNCFRIGGDEFAAVLKNPKPGELEERAARFEEKQLFANVSISYGYASTTEQGPEAVRKIMEDADKNMYEQKASLHRSMENANKQE